MDWSVAFVAGCSFGLCSLALGCGTAYTPQPGPRVAQVIVDGAPALVKDGQVTPIGMFGGGLAKVVADDPAALEYAESFEQLSIAGFVFGLSGGAALGGATGILAAHSEAPSDARRNLGLGLLLGGMVCTIVGSSIHREAFSRYLDAVNTYNDGVDQRIARETAVKVPLAAPNAHARSRQPPAAPPPLEPGAPVAPVTPPVKAEPSQ